MLLNLFKKKITDTNNQNNVQRLRYFNEEISFCILENDYQFEDNYKCFKNNACIYCGCIFEKQIVTSKKCPECGKRNVTRTNAYSKRRVLLKEEDVQIFEKYNNKLKEIKFMEELLEKKEYFFKGYIGEFYKLKNRKLSARDIAFSFLMTVCGKLDNEAYSKYMSATKLNDCDRVLESFEAIKIFENSIMCLKGIFRICEYKKRFDVALNILCDIAYREVQVVQLDFDADFTRKIKEEDFYKVSSGLILEFLENNNLSIKDFKKNFFQYRHPFVLPRLSLEETWYHIEEAFKKQIDYKSKLKSEI